MSVGARAAVAVSAWSALVTLTTVGAASVSEPSSTAEMRRDGVPIYAKMPASRTPCAIRQSSHQAIRPSGHQAIRQSGHQ
eukprot:418-Prymnesium_polylepis.2